MARVVVAGSSGNVGSAAVRQLSQMGVEVKALTRSSAAEKCAPLNPRSAVNRCFRPRGIQNISVTRPHANHLRRSAKCVHQGHVAILASSATHTATQTAQHGQPAHMPQFGTLPSGGAPVDEDASSYGASQSEVAVGAEQNIAHRSAVGRQARSVDPLASHSYIVDSCGGGDEGVREEGKRHAMKKHMGAHLEGCIASGLKLC